jgi:hypothetical protein
MAEYQSGVQHPSKNMDGFAVSGDLHELLMTYNPDKQILRILCSSMYSFDSNEQDKSQRFSVPKNPRATLAGELHLGPLVHPINQIMLLNSILNGYREKKIIKSLFILL